MATGIALLLSTICNATFCDTPAYGNIYHGSETSDLEAANIATIQKEINGKHLKIATYQNRPLSWVQKAENGTLIGCGVAFAILELLQKKFNFTYDLIIPEKNFEMGGDRPEESLVGLINNSLADMAAAFLPKQDSYHEKVAFSYDLDEGVWKMMLKRPKASAAGSGLLAPFDKVVWYSILVTVLLYGPCVTLFTRIRHRLVTDTEDVIPLSPSFWFVYGAFIKQGTNLAPEANTTRVLFATWWVFIILLAAFYTANLTAFLTLSKFTLDIHAPEDLLKKNYRWVSRGGAAVEYAVTNPKEDLHYLNEMVMSGRGKFYVQKSRDEYLALVDDGAVLIKEQVGIIELLFWDYWRKAHSGVPEAERCTYVIAPNTFMTKLRGFAYPKGSKLQPLFDKAITHILQAGLVNYMKKTNLPGSKICPLDLQSTDRQLRNSDLIMTYSIMVAGLFISIAVFGAELFFKHYTLSKRHTKKPKPQAKKTKFKRRPQIHLYQDTSPPSYDSIFGQGAKINLSNAVKRKIVNGREYLQIRTSDGDTRLIPVRTPSAFLYQLDLSK